MLAGQVFVIKQAGSQDTCNIFEENLQKMMEITPLPDFLYSMDEKAEEFLYELSAMHLFQWGHLYPGWTQGEAVSDFKIHGKDKIPCTFIAHKGEEFLGSISLLPEDTPAFSEFSPWLANLFVVDKARKKGIGSQLVQRAIKNAREFGFQKLYLFTENREDFYLKQGWKLLKQDFLMEYSVSIMCLDL